MLGRMAGGRETAEGCIAERDLGPVLHRSVPELVPGLGRAPDLGAGRRAEFQRARDVVVVDVCLDDAPDGCSVGTGSVDEPFDVALRIDDRSLVTPGQDVACVPEPLGDQDVELHRPHPTTGASTDGRRSGSAA